MATTRIKITQAAITKVETPPRKANGNLGVNWFRDESPTSPAGLRLRVNSSGRKDWYFRYTSKSKTQFTSIGSFPDLNVERARKLSKQLAANVAGGGDPVEDQRRTRAEDQLADITLAEALELHLSNRAHDHKPTTIKGYRQAFSSARTGFVPWLKKPIKSLTRQQIESWYRKRMTQGTGSAQREVRLLRAVINTAISEARGAGIELLPLGNPCEVITAKKLLKSCAPRENWITPTQTPVFFQAMDRVRSTHHLANFEVATDLLRFLLFSGCRIQEASQLLSSDIDLSARAFTLHDTKNRSTVTLPLNDELLQIVSHRIEQDSEFVFPSNKLNTPIGRPAKALKLMVHECGFHFTPHDLRRTFRSVAASISIPIKTAAMLVNHKISGEFALDASYIQTTHEELLDASNRIAGEITRRGQEQKHENVVQLRSTDQQS